MKGLKKTVLAVCMAVVLGLGLVPVSALASEAVKTVEITIDGEPFTQDSTTGFAVVKVDSPIVPLPLLRGVLESLGIKFEWQADGDYLITLTKGDKKVYHQRGKSVTSADNPYNEGGAKEILATGNVPSYHDIKANTLMIDLRLILDSFASEGISVEWLRTSPETAGTVAIYINSPDPVAYVTPERPEPELTTENGDEIIWLDENTSVNKTKLLNRLLKQNLSVMGDSVEETVQSRPINEALVSKEFLLQAATEYIESIYNINYQTDTAAKVDALVSKYYTAAMEEAFEWLYWTNSDFDNFDHLDFNEAQQQELIMQTVFISDLSLIHAGTGLPGGTGFITRGSGPDTAVEVRGTMFYRFLSNNNNGKYWNHPGTYELGQWYWSDIGVEFYEEVDAAGALNYIVNAGGPAFYDYEDGWINNEMRERQIHPLSTMSEVPYVYNHKGDWVPVMD